MIYYAFQVGGKLEEIHYMTYHFNIMPRVSKTTVNQRIREVRKNLNLSQAQFSKITALSSGYLAGIETEKREVNERLIKLTCASFNVNEIWLKTGAGQMFSENPKGQFTKLVGLFKELQPRFQDFILKQIDHLLSIQDQK
ncbi:MAG: hypothetical protein Ta2B_20320 [Termitinemataceae bacterium]|nr:MAG: hypothetical protein Ta2B_20320 [Termitinemataceae bacterium]